MRVLNLFSPFLSYSGIMVFKYERVLQKQDTTRFSNVMLWADKLSIVFTTMAAKQRTALKK